MVHGKKYKECIKKIDKAKKYDLYEAISLSKTLHYAKFDASVDIAVKLGVDSRHADQNVRGSIVLPKGLGKKVKILVFAKGEKVKEAVDAGADHVGSEELIDKINGGWLDFDCAISTPDMMGSVGKLGKVLGPRGIMPNPKSGTVTFDLKRVIDEMRAGRLEFRIDKAGIIHSSIGKVSFVIEDLFANANALLATLLKLKPSSSKGVYLRGISISTTMGPGIRVDHLRVASSLGY